jgi:hypothetical protein
MQVTTGPDHAGETPEYKEQPDPMRGRRPWIRVDGAQAVEDREHSGQFEVRISGHNLKMAISPPRVEVGGVPLEHIVFEESGKVITGRLSRRPPGDRVIVDYGFASGETKLS